MPGRTAVKEVQDACWGVQLGLKPRSAWRCGLMVARQHHVLRLPLQMLLLQRFLQEAVP
jgi:hypothetical protein